MLLSIHESILLLEHARQLFSNAPLCRLTGKQPFLRYLFRVYHFFVSVRISAILCESLLFYEHHNLIPSRDCEGLNTAIPSG